MAHYENTCEEYVVKIAKMSYLRQLLWLKLLILEFYNM